MNLLRILILTLVCAFNFTTISFSQSVNLEIITDQDCYEPGDVVTVVFVTRLYISNVSGCENTSVSSAQVRDLTYDMSFGLPDGTTYSQAASPGATSTVGGNITFSYIDTDVINNVTGAVNPSLDPCDDTDVSCSTNNNCPSGFDSSTTLEADWTHAAIFTIPAGMTSGDLTLNAGEDFVFWFNSGGGAPWQNIGAGSEGDTIVIPVLTSCLFGAELTAFEVYKSTYQVGMDWTTHAEVDILEYQIERSSDGRIFTTLGSIQPTYLISGNHYNFIDENPLDALNYYRIATIDVDGTTKYSKVLSIDNSDSQEPIIYPNPLTEVLYIDQIAEVASGNTTIKLFNLMGQLVVTKTLGEDKSIDLSELPKGTYFLKASNKDYSFSRKIQKN